MRKKKPHVAVMNAINGFLVVVCSDVSSAMAGQMRKQRSLFDENELSLDEFGKLISTHNGWGSEYGNRFERKVRMRYV